MAAMGAVGFELLIIPFLFYFINSYVGDIMADIYTLRNFHMKKKYGSTSPDVDTIASSVPDSNDLPCFTNDVDFNPKHDIMCHDLAPTSTNSISDPFKPKDLDQYYDLMDHLVDLVFGLLGNVFNAADPSYVVGSGGPDDFNGVPNAIDVMANYESPVSDVEVPDFIWPGTSPELPESIPIDRNYCFTGRRNYVLPDSCIINGKSRVNALGNHCTN